MSKIEYFTEANSGKVQKNKYPFLLKKNRIYIKKELLKSIFVVDDDETLKSVLQQWGLIFIISEDQLFFNPQQIHASNPLKIYTSGKHESIFYVYNIKLAKKLFDQYPGHSEIHFDLASKDREPIDGNLVYRLIKVQNFN